MNATFKKSRADYPPGLLAIYGPRRPTPGRHYFAVFAPAYTDHNGRGVFVGLEMSEHPSHPQGVGLTSEYTVRPTRGTRDVVLPLDALPPDCRRCVEDYLSGREVECPHCGGLMPELVGLGRHAGERCRVCVNH